MRRIAAVTQAAAFIVTGILVLFAIGLLATKPSHGGPRAALPELTLLGIALVAFLLASSPYVREDAGQEDRERPVEVKLAEVQIDLLASMIDTINAHRTAGPHPIPNGLNFPQSGDRGVLIRETKLPRNGAKHRAAAG